MPKCTITSCEHDAILKLTLFNDPPAHDAQFILCQKHAVPFILGLTSDIQQLYNVKNLPPPLRLTPGHERYN